MMGVLCLDPVMCDRNDQMMAKISRDLRLLTWMCSIQAIIIYGVLIYLCLTPDS
jgi:hypothetical protein